MRPLPVAHYHVFARPNVGDGTIPPTEEPVTHSTHRLVGGFFTTTEGKPACNFATRSSIDLTSSGQLLKSSSNAVVNINNDWSIAMWFYTTNVSTEQCLLDIASTLGNTDRIKVDLRPDLANTPIRIQLYNSTGIIFKDYYFNSPTVLSATNTWMQLAFTWDGTNLKCYFNGIEQTADTLATDTSGIMADSQRSITIGSPVDGSSEASGVVHQLIGWNLSLYDDDIKVSFNHGMAPYFDPRGNYDGYGGYDRVMFWYKFNNVTSVGAAAVGSHTLTSQGATSITSSNLILSAPRGSYIKLNSTTSPATQYLRVDNHNLGLTSANDYTIMLVYKFFGTAKAQPATNQTMMDIRNQTNNNNRIEWFMSATAFAHGMYSGTGVNQTISTTGVSAIDEEEWYVVTLKKSSATDGSVFMNGTSVATSALLASNSVEASLDIGIGTNFTTSARNKSEMCVRHLMIWDKALSDAEIEQIAFYGFSTFDYRYDAGNYTSSNYLLHWVKFGTPALGGEAGGDYTWTMVGDLDFSVGSSGITASSIEIENSGGGLLGVAFENRVYTTASTANIDIANSWSVAGWSYPISNPATTAENAIFYIGPSGLGANRLELMTSGPSDGNGFRARLFESGGSEFKRYDFTGLPSTLSWFFWTLTWDGTNLKLYINGVERTTVTKTIDLSGSMADATRKIMLGDSEDGGVANLQGYSQEMGIWDTALSANAIYDLYLASLTKDYRYDFGQYTNSANLKHYYRIENFSVIHSAVSNAAAEDLVGTMDMDLGSIITDVNQIDGIAS